MPELPEVETISRNLRKSILGAKITDAHVMWPRTIATPSLSKLQIQISDQTINHISRRGKYLYFVLTHYYLVFHLRMSGDILLDEQTNELSKYCRFYINLGDSRRVSFIDTRKFGRVWLLNDVEILFGKLGPEPLSSELTKSDFHNRLISYSRQLKPLLMDQSFLAGLGNIYADEALHLSRLHPQVKSNLLSEIQSSRLLIAIRQVLMEGIHNNGASIDWVYRGGEFQNYFRVYQRTGLPCNECGTKIERIIVAQRSTHICPSCQEYLLQSNRF